MQGMVAFQLDTAIENEAEESTPKLAESCSLYFRPIPVQVTFHPGEAYPVMTNHAQFD